MSRAVAGGCEKENQRNVIPLRFAEIALFFRRSRRLAALTKVEAATRSKLSVSEISLSEIDPGNIPLQKLSKLTFIYRANIFEFEQVMNRKMNSIIAKKLAEPKRKEFLRLSEEILSWMCPSTPQIFGNKQQP